MMQYQRGRIKEDLIGLIDYPFLWEFSFLYYIFAIRESLRIGKARERQAAINELEKYINQYVNS